MSRRTDRAYAEGKDRGRTEGETFAVNLVRNSAFLPETEGSPGRGPVNRLANDVAAVVDELDKAREQIAKVRAQRERDAAMIDTKNARIQELLDEVKELEKRRHDERVERTRELDESRRVIRLLVGKLMAISPSNSRGVAVSITDDEASYILADKRRPLVIHDPLKGRTVVRLMLPENVDAPWTVTR